MINIQLLKQAWDHTPKKVTFFQIGILIALIGLEIGCTILIPEWRKFFYDSLSQFNIAQFNWSLVAYTVLFSVVTLAQGLKCWVGQLIGLHFRTGLTNLLGHLWLSSKVKDKQQEIENPCQRINQDTALCTDLTIRVISEITISAAIVIALLIQTLQSPTILEIATFYTALVVGLTFLFKPILVNREIDLQRAEANHRLSLSEITLGTSKSLTKPTTLFEYVKIAYRRYIATAMNYEFFNRSQGNFAPILIYLFLAPLYFAKTITLGKYMGDTTMFELIVANSTILVQLFPSLTTASASWKRLDKFYRSIYND